MSPEKIPTLFGDMDPPNEFHPLKPLDDCEEEKIEFLIDEILLKKEFTLLAGVKNTNKSWLAAYFAVCASLGKNCFGRKVEQGKVVYVYGEGAMVRRLKMLSKGMGAEVNPSLLPYKLRADLTKAEALDDLRCHIPPGTKLIIIDNYEKFWFSDMDEKSVQAAVRFLAEIRDHACVVLVHHEVKNRRKDSSAHASAKGLSQLVNSTDSTLSLRRLSHVVTCEVYHRETEFIAPFKFRLVESDGQIQTLALVDGSGSTGDLSSVEGEHEECLSKIRQILTTKLLNSRS